MDALSDVLRVMRLKGGVFLHGAFSEPWCLSIKVLSESCAPWLGKTDRIIPYHYILEGRMHVRMEDGFEFEITAGESVLFPHNDRHLLGSDVSRQPVLSEDVVQFPPGGGLGTIVLGADGATSRMICGFLGTESIPGNPVLDALPQVLRFDARRGSSADWLRTTFAYAAERIEAGHMGSEVLMGKLSELLFVEAIQRYTETLDGPPSWLIALKDPHLSSALAMLHDRIGDQWTVSKLGNEVGLSRSALARRFTELLGMPPMQYLAEWRVHVAARELINSNKSLLQIAQEVGYESEAAFSRAFRRLMGAPPATWRRHYESMQGDDQSSNVGNPRLQKTADDIKH